METMSSTPLVRLKRGRDRPIRLGHPWVMSGSVERVEGDPEPGATVEVRTSEDERIASGDFDPSSQIRVRVTSLGTDAPDPGEGWVEDRLDAALAWRANEPSLGNTNAVRVVNAEADGLPGLVVDRYADWIVLKSGTPGMLLRAERVARHLEKRTGVRGAWLRGSSAQKGRGILGDVPEGTVEISERDRRYRVDLRHGQKTGFYLDQRDARDVFERLSGGRRALDLFSHTGGFSVAALSGGASEVVAVESSEPAVRLLRENAPGAEAVHGDVQEFLRRDPRRFELVVCDPPPFARRRKDVSSACRAYKDLNLHVFQRVDPGAHVLTFTCSHHIDASLFRKVVFGAAADAGARLQVLSTLGAAADHAVALHHPQGEYLTGLLLRVVEVS